MSDRKLTLAIDFDGVLHNPLDREPGYTMGKPIMGAVASMKALHQQGHTLVVHTTRGPVTEMGPDGKNHVCAWMRYFEIPFKSLTCIKPNADVYLDDRAVRFVNWNHALMAIEAERQ